ncbi:major facilitator superfamily domain-containing protein [Mycena sp. CBHHK59/15]|nr:major facilitator superfamily domain-containing protein [Mycena sp. CBHHK59/15]
MAGGFGSLPLAEGHVRHDSQTADALRILGPKWAHLPALTIGFLGVQLLWSVEMSYASPYLLSLGLTKSHMAVVFLAGPLAGLLIQPLIGLLADNSTSRWGRRRPYMLGGCAMCVLSMLLLGYTREFAAVFTGRDNHTNDVATLWLAILSIYLVDFCVNVVQAVDRALLVDTLPPAMQASGNAWAARMAGIGSVIGFFLGNLYLPSLLPFLGSSELQGLSVIVSVVILVGHLITAALVKEKLLVGKADQQRPSFQTEIGKFFSTFVALPRVIHQICIIQFFAWLGWFPILFYTTMYISDLYVHSAPFSSTPAEVSAEGSRLGSRALFFSAILALLTNILLPSFAATSRPAQIEGNNRLGIGIPPSFKVSLSTLWACSHLLFGVCMLGTFFVSTVDHAIFLITLTGIPWAVTQWAPFSLLAEAILTSSPTIHPDGPRDEAHPLLALQNDRRCSTSSLDEERAMKGPQPDAEDFESVAFKLDADAPNLSAKAGIILGIHIVFVVIPQFLITILCVIVFAVFDPATSELHEVSQDDGPAVGLGSEKNSDRPNSVVYIFRLGALWSLIAFVICWQLGRELRRR